MIMIMIMIIIITRVKMYVCFGFSLAHLCRARTIDLQCQSLSLCRSFCFAACACRCVELSRMMPLAGQRARKIDQKSSRTSIESRSRVTHRGTRNRPKIAPGTLSGRPVLSKSVPKASRERLGSISERPGEARGVPKKPLGGSRRFFGVPGSPQKIPRREPTFFRDPQIAGTAKKAIDFCTAGGATSSFLCAARSQTDFRSIFSRFSLDFRMFAQVVRGARSQRISIDWGSSAQRPTLTKVWPCHTFVRVGPVGASRLA